MYRLRYDPQTRVDSLVISAMGGAVGVREKRSYDLDGRLVNRERVSTSPGIGQLYLDVLSYDQRGNVIQAQMESRAQQSQAMRFTYDPPGGVVVQERERNVGGYQVEEFRNDAYGNVFYQRTRSSAGTNDAPIVSTYAPDPSVRDKVVAESLSKADHRFREATRELGRSLTLRGGETWLVVEASAERPDR